MKKILIVVLSILTMLCAIGFMACNGCESEMGTYYEYSNGNYDKSSYVILDGSKWKDDDGYNGTYKIQDDKITFYMTLYGYTEEFADGTIKDGVITLKIMDSKITYCKEGSKPDLNKDDNSGDTTTQHTHNYTKTVVEPTCSKQGYTIYKCSTCGYETKNDYVITVTKIREEAFMNCNQIISIAIPNSVTSISEKAFYNCDSLVSIEIPNSVTSIEDSAFAGCRSLTSITIPNSVTAIGSSAFSDCSSLTSITIPNSVTAIGSSAFSDCNGLTNITIPNSVTTIGEGAFSGCSKLAYNEYDNGVYLGNNSNRYVALVGTRSTDIAKCVINNNTKILNGAFENCINIKNISIPNGVKSIGSRTFSGCSNLTSIVIPDSVTSIGGSAFENCSSLTSITIPDSVTSIGDRAFRYCSSLTSITIPDSVTSIGDSAFAGNWNNKMILTNVTFGNNSNLTSIGRYAFSYCSSLTSIVIPDSVISIGAWAFLSCSGLKNVKIGGSVTSIVDHMFYQCDNLTSITIPNSVTSIGEYAFYECNILYTATFNGTVEQWNVIKKVLKWNTTNYEKKFVHEVPLHFTVHCTDGDVNA